MVAYNKSQIEEGFRRGAYSYSWIVLAVMWAAYFVDIFMRYNIPTVIPTLMKEFRWDPSTVGWVDSAYLWAYAIMQIPWGYVSERWLGAKWTVTLGTAMIALASVIFAFTVENVFVAIAARALIGAGAAAIWVPANPMLARWFHRSKRGLQTGLLGTGGTLGTFVGGAAMPIIVTSITLFGLSQIQSGFLLSAIPGLIMVVLVPVLLRNRPEDIGLKSLDVDEPGALETVGTEVPHEPTSDEPSFGYIMRHSWYPYLLAVVYAGFLGTIYFVYTWFATYLNRVYAIDVRTAGLIWAIAVTVPPLISQPFAGVISDRIGKKRAASLALLVTGILAGILILTALAGPLVALWVTVVFMALLALFVQMWVLIWPFTTIMFPTKAGGPIGGVMNTLGQLVGASAPVISGYLIKSTGSFAPVFALGTACAFIGFIGSFFLKEHRVV